MNIDEITLVSFIKWLYKNTEGQLAPYIFNSEEWYAIYTLSLKHKVEAIIYRLLCNQEVLFRTVPSPVKRAFRAIYQYNYRHNIRGVKEANKIARSCSSAGISLCAERGIALLFKLYPEIGMRPMQDIDFLASIEDCSSINDQLRNLGYEISRVNDQPSKVLPSGLAVDSVLYKKVGSFQDYDRQLTIDITYCMKDINLQSIIARSGPSKPYGTWKEAQHEDFFLLLCYGIYDDALEHDVILKPEHCSIGKLLDLAGYSRIHPILLTEQMKKKVAVSFAQICANALLGISLFN